MDEDQTNPNLFYKKIFEKFNDGSATKTPDDSFDIDKIREAASTVSKSVSEKEIKEYVNSEDFKDKVIKVAGEKTDKLIEDLNSKIDSSRAKTVESLGIFVALFTFISIEFQAFKVFEDNLWAIGGITLIMLGALSYFVILVDFVASNYDLSLFKEKEEYGKKTKDFKLFKIETWGDAFKIKIAPLFVSSFIFIIIGVCLLVFSDPIKSDNNLTDEKIIQIQHECNNFSQETRKESFLERLLQ